MSEQQTPQQALEEQLAKLDAVADEPEAALPVYEDISAALDAVLHGGPSPQAPGPQASDAAQAPGVRGHAYRRDDPAS